MYNFQNFIYSQISYSIKKNFLFFKFMVKFLQNFMFFSFDLIIKRKTTYHRKQILEHLDNLPEIERKRNFKKFI